MMILRKTSLREHSGWNRCGEGAWTSSREGAAPGGHGGLPATDARIHGAWPTAGEDADGEGHARRQLSALEFSDGCSFRDIL